MMLNVMLISEAQAQTTELTQQAVFTLQDNTNLPAGTYQLYVTGYSTAGPYVLQPDGSWDTPTAPSPANAVTTIPCYQFPQEITQVQISGTQSSISARVYYFVVTDTTTFPQCSPTSNTTGLFNKAGNSLAFTYTLPSLNLSLPTAADVLNADFPAWAFSEIGASSDFGTIDLSQVDFLTFPMNTTATVSVPGVGNPLNPSEIGNPVDAIENPNNVVNTLSLRDSYSAFVNGMAQTANNNKSCSEDDTPEVCAYLDLLLNITTGPAGTVPQYAMLNPGAYLALQTTTTNASVLNTVFDSLIEELWTTSSPPTLTIDTGGPLGGDGTHSEIPRDVFTSSIVTLDYPGSTQSVKAMKFTGTAASNNYVAYVFSPKDFQDGCAATTDPIPGTACPSPTSTGWQVFAGGGMLAGPINDDTYNDLLANNSLSADASTYGSIGYSAVVARLGFLISGAMNRGVALVSCSKTYTWQCWQDETYWYPTATSSTNPDITQNLFSQWIHTADISGTPMFVQAPSAVKSAGSTAGTGKTMGMAYGFSNDENPTPSAVTPPQPEVPSKLDSTVIYGDGPDYAITFGPWVTDVMTPTLALTTAGDGSVSSSPAGINCGSSCSYAFTSGTSVILTASPGSKGLFDSWSGACSGSSTTCTVTIDDTTVVAAKFGSTSLSSPDVYGLHVVENGSGAVNSSPSGIECGSSCSAAFDADSSVTLSASAATGWSFAGWTGACSGSSSPCSVTMTQAQTVGASYVNIAHFTLAVENDPNGIVTSMPGAIDCGTRCFAGLEAGTAVSLIARPNAGYQFDGWSGACTGSSTCDLVMTANRNVKAMFVAVTPGFFTLTVHDYGEGIVFSSPAGIECGNNCSANFRSGTEVKLEAIADPGFQFNGWSGACQGEGDCTVWMDAPAFVNARFVIGVAGIPTLSEWALILMGLLILLLAYRHHRIRV